MNCFPNSRLCNGASVIFRFSTGIIQNGGAAIHFPASIFQSEVFPLQLL